jgi:uncharacterized membrane protein
MALVVSENKIVAKRNNSFSTGNNIKLLAVISLVVFLVSVNFARMGAWLVMPFAGLELLAFAYAFYLMYLHADDFESITINDENLLVEKKSNKSITSVVFSRYWAQVDLRVITPKNGLFAKSVLVISSHGQEVEFGSQLVSEAQRKQLALELKRKVKNII